MKKSDELDYMDAKLLNAKALHRLHMLIRGRNARQEALKGTLAESLADIRAAGDIVISDHAIVRYLARHKGLDIDAVCEEIKTIAMRARQNSDEPDWWTDPETGVRLAINFERPVVTTIFSDAALKLATED